MWQSAFKVHLIALVGILTGCQYQLGESTNFHRDRFVVDTFHNDTLYRGLPQQLQELLIEALKGQEAVRIDQDDRRARSIGGTFLSVQKKVYEENEFGQPTELQFIVELQLVVEGLDRPIRLNNHTFRRSSGTFRPIDTLHVSHDAGRARTEEEALEDALKDLASAVMLHLQPPKK